MPGRTGTQARRPPLSQMLVDDISRPVILSSGETDRYEQKKRMNKVVPPDNSNFQNNLRKDAS
jgi:hypothetical protein